MILGYCCINLSIGSKFKGTTQKWLRSNYSSVENKLLNLYENNLSELSRVLKWNILNNIRLYRISSDIIPFADHRDYMYLWNNYKKNPHSVQNSVKEYLEWGGRICIHPSQYVSLGCERETVRGNSIQNLIYHGELLDFLGCPCDLNAPINIHLSNGRNIENAVPYIRESLSQLPQNVLSRLVFETEDGGNWRWQNIIKYFFDFPVTLDFHHWKINNIGENISEVVKNCVDSWGNFDPIFHHSEGKTHPLDRSHSDYIESLPDCYDGYLELEAKAKDLAVLKLQNS